MLEAGERVTLDQVGVFAEGVAVAQIGEAPFAIVRDLIDGVITVNTDEMCAAVKDTFEDTRAVAETSGALALAGLKKYIQQTGAEGETLLCINSGANTNFDRLQHIAERAATEICPIGLLVDNEENRIVINPCDLVVSLDRRYLRPRLHRLIAEQHVQRDIGLGIDSRERLARDHLLDLIG